MVPVRHRMGCTVQPKFSRMGRHRCRGAGSPAAVADGSAAGGDRPWMRRCAGGRAGVRWACMLQGVMEQHGLCRRPILTARCLAALLDARDRFGAAVPRSSRTRRACRSTYKRAGAGGGGAGASACARGALQGGRLGVMLPNANGAVVTFMALQAFGAGAGDAELSRRARRGCCRRCAAAQVGGGVVVARFCGARRSWAPVVEQDGGAGALRVAGGCARGAGAGREAARPGRMRRRARRVGWRAGVGGGGGGGAVHQRVRRGAEGCGAEPPPTYSSNIAQVAVRDRLQPAPTGCSTLCRCSTRSG